MLFRSNPPNAAAAMPAHAESLNSPSRFDGSEAPVEEKTGFLTKIFGDDRDLSDSMLEDGTDEDDGDDVPPPMPPVHEGVWVTLTQTNGATPFFDTLLVLVVSPLVTLTVVYAMLLIRSRIRRRRWRAPKSVVQQLPVRTFIARDTRNDSNSSQGGAVGRSHSPLPGSEATPLLGRPRSQTTSGLPEPGLSRTNSSTGLLDEPKPLGSGQKGSGLSGQGKDTAKAKGSQWKKYMGRQVECVVCLEEYVDGVSRVMSLPCGHEFHVECMYVFSFLFLSRPSVPFCPDGGRRPCRTRQTTLRAAYGQRICHAHGGNGFTLTTSRTPWLTTRRRTCPICKGDVVRSLQRNNNSASGSTSPRYVPYQEDGAHTDDEQERAARARNDSPSADRPISPGEEDIEQGVREASPRQSRGRSRSGEGSGSWFHNVAARFGLTSSTPAPEEGRRRD